MIISTTLKSLEINDENISNFSLNAITPNVKQSKTLNGKYEKVIFNIEYSYTLTISNIKRELKNNILTLLKDSFVKLDNKITINSNILYDLFYNEDYDNPLISSNEKEFEFSFESIGISQKNTLFSIDIPLVYINYDIN